MKTTSPWKPDLCRPISANQYYIMWHTLNKLNNNLQFIVSYHPWRAAAKHTGIIKSSTLWDVMAHWLRRLLSTGGSWVRLPLWPSRRDLGQVLYLQLPVCFGVKLRYSIRAVVGSASEW